MLSAKGGSEAVVVAGIPAPVSAFAHRVGGVGAYHIMATIAAMAMADPSGPCAEAGGSHQCADAPERCTAAHRLHLRAEW